MTELAGVWPVSLRLSEIQRDAPTLALNADPAQRLALAKALDLVELTRFDATVKARPWMDGAEIASDWSAEVVQTCGISLEPFSSALEGSFRVRVAPAGSASLPASPVVEVSIDPEAEDPPELLDGDAVDVGGYLVEHLALELDPFPRRPGATFEPPAPESPPSPFAVLRGLKTAPDAD